jgi:hypothetical protein
VLGDHRQFFEKGAPVLIGNVSLARGDRNRMRTDLPEMQVGRKPAGAVQLGRVAAGRVTGEAVHDETLQPR